MCVLRFSLASWRLVRQPSAPRPPSPSSAEQANDLFAVRPDPLQVCLYDWSRISLFLANPSLHAHQLIYSPPFRRSVARRSLPSFPLSSLARLSSNIGRSAYRTNQKPP